MPQHLFPLPHIKIYRCPPTHPGIVAAVDAPLRVIRRAEKGLEIAKERIRLEPGFLLQAELLERFIVLRREKMVEKMGLLGAL